MKKWFASKTIWFNIATAAFGVLALVGNSGLFGPTVVKLILLVVAVGNFVLRFVTNKGIGSTASSQAASNPTQGQVG